jgi:hypothetical protein
MLMAHDLGRPALFDTALRHRVHPLGNTKGFAGVGRYFATLLREPEACKGATGFAGGQVASKRSSAPASPSLENLAVCVRRRPSGACDVSVKSNCGSLANARTPVPVMRTPQISNPPVFSGGDLKYSDAELRVEIESVGKNDEVVVVRWKSSWNCSVLKQNSRHCAMR